jgi:hypothetical protein
LKKTAEGYWVDLQYEREETCRRSGPGLRHQKSVKYLFHFRSQTVEIGGKRGKHHAVIHQVGESRDARGCAGENSFSRITDLSLPSLYKGC